MVSQKRRALLFRLMLLVVCLAVVGLSVYASAAFRMDDSYLSPAEVDGFDGGWTAVVGGERRAAERIPRQWTAQAGRLTLENTLPAIEGGDVALCFLSESEDVTARVNGETIFRYGAADETPFGRYWGSVWCLIPLKESYSGQKITIELVSRGDDSVTGNYRFFLDQRAAILNQMIVRNLFLLSNCLIGLASGASLLCSSLYRALLRRPSGSAQLYLGALVVLVSVWAFTNAHLSQLLLHSAAVSYLLNYATFFSIGVPFSLLLSELFPRLARRYRAFAAAFAGFFAASMALYASGAVEISALLPIEHAMMALMALDSVVACAREARQKRVSRTLPAGVTLFTAFAMGALAWYYVAPTARLAFFSLNDLLMLGIDGLVVLFHVAIVRQGVHESDRAQMFQRQAYTDAMTGAGNRAAFELRMESLADRPACPRALFMIDLNNLKVVNDTLGHETGDLLIRGLVDALRESFGPDGEIYRYGGDEFVVLMEGARRARTEAARVALERALAERNARGGCAIDAAVGLAVDEGGDAPVRALLHRADADMYAVKQRQKAGGAPLQLRREALREQVDPLTGLAPFPAFRQRVFERLSGGAHGKFAIVNFDVNHFDGYNSLFGWAAGDRLLKQLGGLALKLCGEDGFCGHGDADSFWVFTPFDAPEDVFSRIRAQAQSFAPPFEEIRLFLSFGVYAVDDLSLTVSEMCHRATLAKRSIKGRFDRLYALYDSARHVRQTAQARLIGYMQSGLAKEEFVPYYQPQFSADGARIVGAEALVRWEHADGTITPPNDFIELFENSGLLLSLDRYMFDRVCRAQKRRAASGGLCPPVSVNLSRLHAYAPGGARAFREILDRCGLAPERVCVELTETAFVAEPERMAAFVDDLRAEGFLVAMDDFGSGQSSLGQLSRLNVDVIKFDRAFLRESLSSVLGRVIVESMLLICRRHGIRAVAEGVERPEQLEFLRAHGCDAIQGDLFAPAMPEEAYERLLQSREI